MRRLTRFAILTALHLMLAALPMTLAMVVGPALSASPHPGRRGPAVEFGVALGYAALGLMAVQFALIGRFGPLSRRLGQDVLLGFHAWAGVGSAILLWAHPLVLILADRQYAEFFDPRSNLLRAMALSFALLAATALVVLSIARRRFALAYEWWRLSHAALAVLLMLVALAHAIMVGRYTNSPAAVALVVAYTLGPVALLIWLRVLSPRRRRPWRVASVRKERDAVWTIELDAHHGTTPFSFVPGQFVWVTFAEHPWHPRQHPFSIASSAASNGGKPNTIALTIKEQGDFTRRIGSLCPGTRAWVEGPAGTFVLPQRAPRAVLFAGGIGITPFMAMLRTMVDVGDARPVTLVYGTRSPDNAIFTEELARMEATLDLIVIHVPEHPPEAWEGASGPFDRDLIGRILSAEALDEAQFMICGPGAMMDSVERALLALGVARERIHSERFEMLP